MEQIRACIAESKRLISEAETQATEMGDDPTLEQRDALITKLHEAWKCYNDAVSGLFDMEDAE